MPQRTHRPAVKTVLFAAASAFAVVLPLFSALAVDRATTVVRLEKDLSYLAADELEGRGVGTGGLDEASKYVAAEFKAAGLEMTAVDGTPFQTFSLPSGAKLGEGNRLVLRTPYGLALDLELGKDFEICSFGGSGVVNAELVFCGYGIDNPKVGYNDYENVDVKDKIAVIMRRTPQQGVKDGPFTNPHGGIGRDAELRTKVSQAFGKGAKGILFVNDPYTGRTEQETRAKQIAEAKEEIVLAAQKLVASTDPADAEKHMTSLKSRLQRLDNLNELKDDADADELMKFGYGGNGKTTDLPMAHIRRKISDRMLDSGLGTSLAQVEADIDKDLKPRSGVLKGWTAELHTSIELEQAEIANVIGVLEGEGPHADETIVIGAHYDHVGMGGVGSLAPGVKAVHNGADDNGSGTVSLIELARRFASREKKPSHRLVFIAFTAEELGLIGSQRYVSHPVFPLDKTIAMFNMDMVGRLDKEDKLTVFGTGTSTRWKPLVVKEGEAFGFRLSLQPEGFGPSDHSSFYGKKIPVLHFFTGTHSDYHRPTDDVEKINFDGMKRVVDLVEQIVLDTDANPKRPDYVEIKQRANIGRSGSRPYFGSIPDFGSEGKGYALSGVSKGSPADKGGLKAGDRIIQVGEIKIGDLNDFDLALRRFSAGDEIAVKVLRDGEEKEFKITLAPPR